jgi:hypothetical protein
VLLVPVQEQRNLNLAEKEKTGTMNFRKYLIILAVFLSALLIVQPAISAENVTTVVTNLTADLENDAATKFFNYGEQTLNQGDFGNAITFFDQALAVKTIARTMVMVRDESSSPFFAASSPSAAALLKGSVAFARV